jgi:hypothetical protein
MAETKRKITIFGNEVPVTEVPIVEGGQDELFLQYKLEDGTVLKVKSVATSALRVDNQFLPDGRPIYIVLTNPVVSVLNSPFMKDSAVTAEARKAN